jgi:hypothetical protein
VDTLKLTSLKVDYDAADRKAIWRCYFHVLFRSRKLFFLFGPPVLALFIGPLVDKPAAGLLFAIAWLGAHFLPLSLDIDKTCSSPRLYSLSLSETGMLEGTPEGENKHAWLEVKEIEYKAGDIYFYMPKEVIFVPRHAFQTESAKEKEAVLSRARAYYEGAQGLLARSRQ